MTRHQSSEHTSPAVEPPGTVIRPTLPMSDPVHIQVPNPAEAHPGDDAPPAVSDLAAGAPPAPRALWGEPPPGEQGEQPIGFSEFITDGSIVRLCDELARMTRVPIWLRDADGRVIVPLAEPGPHGRLWTVLDFDAGARRAFELVGREFPPPPGGNAPRLDVFSTPLRLRAKGRHGPILLGQIEMPADWGGDDPSVRRAIERALTLLAGTAVELCQDQIELRRKLHELDAMFRLSSLLVRADDPDQILSAALDLALSTLRMDAGSIFAMDPDTGAMVPRASRGLSPDWVARTTPLSTDGQLRSRAMQGEVVAVENIATDPRVGDKAAAAGESVSSLIMTGLLFQGRAGGMIRLYGRAPRHFSPQDHHLLRSIADQAAMALAHARLRSLREQDQRIQRQVRVAADVQRRMLPQKLPQIEPFDLAARYAPSFHLGGDFYDLFARRGELVMAVCDVAGKGVPAALLMSAVRASLRAHTQEVEQLDEVMARLNRGLARDTLESEFATLWLGTADPRTLRLTYCGAGHDPPFIFRCPVHREPTCADVDELAAGGMVLGIDPSQRYQVGSFDLRPRDILLAYTDGLPDASNYEGKKFGKDRIRSAVLELLAVEPDASAARVIEHLVQKVRAFAGLNLHDDLTMVVLRVRPPVTAPDGGPDAGGTASGEFAI